MPVACILCVPVPDRCCALVLPAVMGLEGLVPVDLELSGKLDLIEPALALVAGEALPASAPGDALDGGRLDEEGAGGLTCEVRGTEDEAAVLAGPLAEAAGLTDRAAEVGLGMSERAGALLGRSLCSPPSS